VAGPPLPLWPWPAAPSGRRRAFRKLPAEPFDVGSFVFVIAMLAAGAIGEELIFRGYGLQVLIAGLGPWATILPVGVLFGVLHAANPAATP